MKKLFIATTVLMVVACSKEEKIKEEKSGSLSDLVTTAKDYSKINNSLEEVSKNVEKLKAMTPLTNEQLKSLLPEQLIGLKRTELTVGDNSMLNLSSAEAKFSDKENKEVKLEILDGAGETGSAMVSMLMMGLNMNKEKITETGFERSEDINGGKAIVSEDKNGENISSKIQMMIKNRYLLTLSGEGLSYEELKKGLAEINISDLK
ncbi:hypothetical protein FNJ88_13180 [Chryseobacterium sp. SNU WT5]|uniref:hypothetical protein n=1 Tax=Chryseobacterium sp. SNU WT5 TaxID=2594269 RepID=UPI00117BE851|nr:hypothetical protein [Chryseobacterium sp. SNU WT5]QDP86459.1 hypothetical protein FNJ88_13180 [Chryseobacterium sp. SNU WT5]